MISNIKRFWRYGALVLPYWDKLLLSIFVENAVALGLLLPPMVLRVLFDYAYPYRDLKLLLILGVIPFVLTFFLNILLVLRSFIDLYIDQQVLRKIYKDVYSTIQRLPLRYFYTYRIGDLIYKMTHDVRIIERTVLNTIPSGLTAIIKLIVLLIICFTLNKTLTLIAILGLPIHFIQSHHASEKMKHYTLEKEETNSGIYDLLQERLSNIKLLKLFHRWSEEVSLLLKQVSGLFFIERQTKLASSFYGVVRTLTSRFWALMLGLFAGYSVIVGTLSIGEVVAITAYIAMLQTPFDTLMRLYRQFITAQVSFKRITDILVKSVEIPADSEIGIDRAIQGHLTFENVTFGYDKRHLVLRDISIDIQPGTSLAILGKSGIGKSSFIDLILRFYSVSGGKILLDDLEINAYQLASLRRQIGLISHESGLFYGTIKDNISFGYEHDITVEMIVEAAKKADAHNFIMALPDGYNTEVGAMGMKLSSGQRQRIAIARAIVNDPKILIFDEATTLLDAESDLHIQKTLSKFKKNKTVIVITHRLTSIRNVDRIVILGNDGRIVEQGKVLELMNANSLFHKLYEAETGGFQRFIQQLQFVLKSVRRFNRPLSVGLLLIKHYTQLSQAVDESEREFLIEDIHIAISRVLGESDFYTYHSEGQFYLAFPEIEKADAKKLGQQLLRNLKAVKSKSSIGTGVTFGLSIVQSEPDDTVSSLSERLLKEIK